MVTYPIRPVAEDELAAFLAVDQHASHGTPMSERAHANFLARLEFGRTLAAFDGDTIVGGTGAFSFQMRVPGAMAAVAGVSLVAVLPSHRRQGILSALMGRQLADVSERGEAVAVLFASESGIYRRYGYGPASWHAAYRLQRGEGTLAPGAPADPGLRLRIAEPLSARAELAKVYDLALAERPGLYARTEPWWDRLLTDLYSEVGSSQQIRCVLAEDDSGPRAYAVFTSTERWDEDAGLPGGVLEVSEALATDPAATAALWDNLLSRDLVSEFHARMRPVDDPLLYLLADPRRVRSVVSDGLWVRLVDVGRALAQRHYASPVDVVIEVADELCPQNAGRWRLAAEASAASAGFRATCERTAAPADVVLPVWAVGAAYLGGAGLKAMASAGLITEATPGSLAALSTAMSWEPAPWCPMTF
ncbi:MAG TPA: GNAT family N-acetyltransferase [Streptosporangiaceae bacterium]|nr:GNAT family N-acetyltransferase [Streptosporangiaceae bacterium]